MSQTVDIKKAINTFIANGMTDKDEIYTKIVEELHVPRPTVRRVASDFRKELSHRMTILEAPKRD